MELRDQYPQLHERERDLFDEGYRLLDAMKGKTQAEQFALMDELDRNVEIIGAIRGEMRRDG